MAEFHYRCSDCDATYDSHQVIYECEHEGSNLDVVLDYGAIGTVHSPKSIGVNRDSSIWRYGSLLPVGMPSGCSGTLRVVGGTPLFRAKQLENVGTVGEVWFKDDTQLPTASLKDRASALVVAYALENGIKRIITASTGNAGVALAGMAAAAGLESVVVAPEAAPAAKLAQILVYGARLVLIQGTYSDAFDLTVQASREMGWYCRNTGYNPLTVEGKKTVAFEICEQFTLAEGVSDDGQWIVPDRVIVPVGDGNIITGVHKGFNDLMALGWINSIPKLTGVQAAGSSAIANAAESGNMQITPVVAATVADSISADRPSDGRRALRAVEETGGSFVTVSDHEIVEAMFALARSSGIFAEPAGAAGYAGCKKLEQLEDILPDERVVILVTGHGLKDTTAALQNARNLSSIEPSLEALCEAIA